MFSASSFKHRKVSKSHFISERPMRIEALENRDLLSVSPMTDLQDLAAVYSSFPISENLNCIDVAELTVENLRDAIEQASQTVADDVIVVHTTADNNSINLNGSALVIDVDSDLYGSIALVGLGDSMLTISNTQENVVVVRSGDVYFSGISFLAQESAGQSFQTDNVVVASESSNVAYSRSMLAVENASSDVAPDVQSDLSNVPMESCFIPSHSYKLDINISGTKWAYVTGLSLEDYNQLQTWEYEGTISGNFIDAEKDYYNYDDDNLCWAASASNILWYTGWANPYLKDDYGNSLFRNEDDVFQYFVDHFTDEGGTAYNAHLWFITGLYIAPDSHAQLTDSGGGFYSNSLLYIYFINKSKDVSSFSDMDCIKKLRDDYGMSMSIACYEDGERSGHALTAWGYVYDTSYSDASYYQGVLVTDSDNNKRGKNSGVNALNTLTYVQLEWNDSRSQYQLTDYSSIDYYLEGFDYLASYESVNTVEQLSTPSLSVSLTGSNSVSVTVGSVDNASGYLLEYSTNPDFTNAITRDVSKNSRTFSLSGLSPNSTYYFRVKALGSLDYSESYYSSVKTVTTNKIQLSAPVLSVSPTGSNSVSVTVGSVENASEYLLEYSTNPNFTNVITRDVDENSRTFSLNGLAPNSTYYFRVKALGSLDYSDSDYSSVKTVTTNKIQLSAPALSVNATGSNSVSVTVDSVANASGYTVEYSTNANFDNAISQNVSAGTTIISELTANTMYYFRAQTLGSGDYSNSDYSAVVSATTLPIPVIDAEVNACIVFQDSLTTEDISAELPVGIHSVRAGNTVYAEIWIKDAESSDPAIIGGYLNMLYDNEALTVLDVVYGEAFILMTGCQQFGNGEISMIGGLASTGVLNLGDDEWVRLATVSFLADADGITIVSLGAPAAIHCNLTRTDSITLSNEQIDYGSSELVITPACPMDINGDGVIAIADYALLSRAWLSTPDKPNWNPACDFDGDGVVAISDYTYLSINWMKLVTDPDLVYPSSSANAAAAVRDDALDASPEVMVSEDVIIASATAAVCESSVDNQNYQVFQANTSILPSAAPVAVKHDESEVKISTSVSSDLSRESFASPLASPAMQLVSEKNVESSLTLPSAYSAALLDLFDNLERADLFGVSAVLAESRLDVQLFDVDSASSRKTSSAAVDAVLEEELLAIDWND